MGSCVKALKLFLIYGFALSIIVLALAISVLRFSLPLLDEYNQPLVSLWNERSAFKLDVGSMSGTWHRLRPNITLSGVTVTHEQVTAHVETVHVGIDVLKTLLNGVWTFDVIRISDADLNVDSELLNQWHQLKNEASPAVDLAEVAQWLWRMRHVSLEQIQVTVQGINDADITLPSVSVYGDKQSDQLIWRFQFDDSDYASTSFFMQAHNRLGDDDFSVQWHLDYEHHPSLSTLIAYILPAWQQTQGSLLLDGSIVGGVWDVSGELQARARYIYKDESSEIVPNVSARIRGLFTHNSQQLWLHDTQVVLNDASIGLKKTQVVVDAHGMAIHVDSLALDSIVKLASHVEHPANHVLAGLAPSGDLKGLRVLFAKESTGAQHPFLRLLSMQGYLENGSISDWSGVPAIDHVDGWVTANVREGVLHVDSDALSLQLPQLYGDQQFEFERVRGDFFWRVFDKRVSLGSHALRFDSQTFASGVLDLQVDIPVATPGSSTHVSLLLGLAPMPATRAFALVPSVLAADVRQWLNSHVMDGMLHGSRFLFHGPVLDASKQVIKLEGAIKNGRAQFAPQWPVVSKINGSITLASANRLDVTIQQAMMQQVRVRNAHATIRRQQHETTLVLNTDIHASTQVALDVLSLPVLDPALNNFASTLGTNGAGKVKARLSLQMPLHDLQTSPDVYLRASLIDMDVTLLQQNLTVRQLHGELTYSTQAGLASNDLRFYSTR